LILDACRDEGKSVEGIGRQTAEQARQMGVISIASCSPNEISYEIEDLQQGSFTCALLEGLGPQGQCATVERLNQYLIQRVTELNRQFGKPKQTPLTIAEPIEKSHLILLPKYATLDDERTLKYDASQAELNKNLDLAEQLWIRVLVAFPGDMDAIKAVKRIAVAKIQPAAIPYQPSSKNSATTEKSPQPAPPHSTPIEPDAPLKSERGVDYTNLRDLLAAKKWQDADEETARVMLKVAGREKEGWLDRESIEKFPCDDLRTIDQLWLKYSNGDFGLSVQKRIYQSLGGTSEYDTEVWERFGDRVGWRKKNSWRYYDPLTFSEKTPEACLPCRGVGVGWGVGRGSWFSFLVSRLARCNI